MLTLFVTLQLVHTQTCRNTHFAPNTRLGTLTYLHPVLAWSASLSQTARGLPAMVSTLNITMPSGLMHLAYASHLQRTLLSVLLWT